MTDFPPEAQNVVLIDFDGTIVPWGPLMGAQHVDPDTARAIRRLKDAGLYIVIFSSRFSPRWLEHHLPKTTLEEQTAYVRAILDAASIPYDELTAEKMPAMAYFDDMAFRVTREWPLHEAITAFLANKP